MSEEEKKAIEIIKKEITKPKETPKEVYITDIKMLLSLVKIQQNEIETLEIIHNTYKEMIEENDYISKDKIRAKIKELENSYKNGKIKQQRYYDAVILLEEVLEEN